MGIKQFKRSVKDGLIIPALARAPSRREVVHILHVAKTGGTAMHGALPLEPRLDRLKTPSHTVFFRNHAIWLSHIPSGQKVVFGVRCPLRRFVSGFYSRKRGGRYGRPIRAYEQEAFAAFDTPRDLARALSSHDHELREQAERAIGAILHTRVKLSDWVGTAEHLAARADDIAYVYQQENLTDDFARMRGLLGLPDVELPQDAREAHRLGDHYDTSLDEVADANLRAWYAEDFRVIDACVELFSADGRMSKRRVRINAAA